MRPSPTAVGAASTSGGRLIGLAALVLGSACIGAAAIFVRLAEAEGVGPTAAAAWRLAIALPALLVWAALAPAPQASVGASRPIWPIAVLAGMFFALDLGFWHIGLLKTTAANATLLPNLAPIVVVLVSWAVFKERITARFLMGGAGALAGAALVTGGAIGADAERLLGDLICLITALWYGLYLLTVKVVRARWSAARVMAVSTTAAVLPLFGVAWLLGEGFWPASALGWVWLVCLGFVAHIAGQGGIAFGLGRLPASLSSIVILVQPLVAALLGAIVFGEPVTLLQGLGAALVVGGVVFASRTAPPATKATLG